jgi:L-ascorbate metabolism protein UlaG (beta-lactamase superfamily)
MTMQLTRRHTLSLGAGTLAGFGLTTFLPIAARAQEVTMDGDGYVVADGAATLRPVEHASFVMTVPGMVIYNDPVGGADAYAGLPPADLILITHEHGDHFDVPTLTGLLAANANARLLTNPAVHGMLPAEIQAVATAIANGEDTTANDIAVAAIPAYNTTPESLKYHPPGRDNGYVLTLAGKRIYIAGDPEDIPEMRGLEGIDLAFVPMNPPYTGSVEQAASAVIAFAPAVVYPYHYGESDTEAFARLVADAGGPTQVVLHDWYPGD